MPEPVRFAFPTFYHCHHNWLGWVRLGLYAEEPGTNCLGVQMTPALTAIRSPWMREAFDLDSYF